MGRHSSIVAFFAKNTLTKNGSVKRGVLASDKDHNMTELVESKLEWRGDDIYGCPLEGGEMVKLDHNALVSMNMFCFSKDIIDRIEEGYVPFLEANKDNLGSCEYLIPTVVDELIKKGEVSCKVLSTTAVWHGVTYREDKDEVVNSLRELVKAGEYPADRF